MAVRRLPAQPPNGHIEGLSRGLAILDYVHATPSAVGIKEIATAVDLKLGTAYHLVNTLLYEGYLVRGDDRFLRPGRLPGPAQGSADDDVSVRRALGRAAYTADDVAVLARLDGALTRVTATAEVPGAACTGHYPVDACALSHMLAVGRVILAHQPPDEAEKAIELTRRMAAADGELFDIHELRDDLAATGERHYCAFVGDGDACVAAPVLGADGHAVAAVAVVVPPRRVRHDIAYLRQAAVVAAREITHALEQPMA
jgi:IclR family transcriptional regulator, acetate operon repressor